MGMLSVVCNPVPTGNKASRVDKGNLVLEFAPRRPFCTSSVGSHRGGTFVHHHRPHGETYNRPVFYKRRGTLTCLWIQISTLPAAV
jgi:hypothetical protein